MAAHHTGDSRRRFGAHLRLTWWRPIIVVLVPPVAMVLLQLAFFAVIALLGGGGIQQGVATPLQTLAATLSMGVTGLLSIPFVARMAKVPWRRILSHPRRLDRRRFVVYLLWALGFTILGNGALAVLAPERTPWVGFGVSTTTIAFVVIILTTMPLQAAAEELMFRGAMMPAVASWVRPERAALGLGIVVSSVAFAVTHLATDLWMFGYLVFLGVATALMAIRSRGLEAPIAWHVANNVFSGVLQALLSDGGDFAVDRSAGVGGPHLLVPAACVLATVAVVWVREGRAGGDRPADARTLGGATAPLSP